MLIKSILVWLIIFCAEVINGNFRIYYLQKRFSTFRAKQISTLLGLILIYGIAYILVPWIEPSNQFETILIGFVWVVLMIGADVYVGKFVFCYRWEKILEDFNLLKGNLLSLGIFFLFLAPWIVIYVL